VAEGAEVTIAGDWSKLAVAIYGDALKPGVQAVGRALGDVVGLLPLLTYPLAFLSEKQRAFYRRNLENYRRRLEHIEPETATSIPPEIAIPILERFAYVSNEEIGALFAQLLASASQDATASKAHPSFIHAIDCLAPDEAILLSYMATHQIPFVDVVAATSDKAKWIGVAELQTDISHGCHLTYPENIPVYLQNLSGLGLVRIERGFYLEPRGTIYDPLTSKFAELAKPHLDEEYRIPESRIGFATITRYGQLFLEACTKEKVTVPV
jgi:hypothetical protein